MQDGPDYKGRDDSASVGPSLRCSVVDVGMDVRELRHPWGKDKELNQQRSDLQVVYCNVYIRVGGRHQFCLGCWKKGVTPNKLLGLLLPIDPSHAGTKCIGHPHPGHGKIL